MSPAIEFANLEETILFQGNKYVTCFLKNDILIIDTANRNLIFKTTADKRISTTKLSFDELQIKQVQITECYSEFAQILFKNTDGNQALMTINGDQTMNSKEKIHSIETLNGSAFKYISSSITENVITTLLLTGNKIAAQDGEVTIVTTYLNGPILKVNLDGVDKKLVFKVKAKAAYQKEASYTDPKEFTINHIENSLKNTMKITATKDSKPKFVIDVASEIEEYLEITGAVVDLALSGENAPFFKLKGRKNLHGSFPVTPIANKNTRLQIVGNYLVSLYNDKQIQFNYQPGTSHITGQGSAKYPSTTGTSNLPEYVTYALPDKNVRFAIRGTGSSANLYTVRDTSSVKEGESMAISFSSETWAIERHSSAISFSIMGTDAKVWVIQKMANSDKRYNVQIWKQKNNSWGKQAELDLKMEKDPTVTNWIVEGDDLWFLYGW